MVQKVKDKAPIPSDADDAKLPGASGGRRKFLKHAAATAGAVAASGVIDGFPLVWSQTMKDVKLVQVGGSYSAIKEIADQATKDLGFKVEMQTAPHDALLNRLVTQPQSIDIADIEYFFQLHLLPRATLQPIDVKKIKLWDKIVPIFTKGEYPDGRKVSTQGVLPFEVQYIEKPGDKKFATKPTGLATGIPTVYNADTLGIRPDLVKRKIESWAELLNPEWKGKTSIVSVPGIGIMDAAMAIEARGDMKYKDKGNMTKEEIDKTIDILIKAKKAGQFRAFWATFDESVNLMAAGETIVQSMWSPAVTAVRSRGIPCYYAPLKEGYRAWASCIAPMAHLKGPKLDAAYAYLNWYLDGWQGGFIAKQGYYSSIPETAKKFMTPDEYGFWYEGKPAKGEIRDPYGNLMEKPGATRDGGAFWDRMGKVACWNTLMDENRYMVQKWNEFLAA
ncbi:MAG TPA: extracellular solute-binding protein [Burkholderiales bacterium]|nr:extracellular solute-binding protein [Burkholderiales bacterium]